MGATNGLALPIPELTDTADGPDAISDLANAVEDYVFDRILPTGVTRYPAHDWGSVTTLPSTGVKVGDTAYYSTFKVTVIWNGTAWRQTEIPVVTDTDNTSGFYDGQYRDVVTRGLERWDGSTNAWKPVSVKDSPMVRVRRTPSGVAAGTFTTLTWDIEDVDTHDMREAANTAVFKIKRAGYYRVSFQGAWNTAPAAGRTAIRIYKALAATPTAFAATWIGSIAGHTGAFGIAAQAHGIVPMAVGDLFRFDIFQDSSGSQTTGNDDFSQCYAEAQWLRPL